MNPVQVRTSAQKGFKHCWLVCPISKYSQSTPFLHTGFIRILVSFQNVLNKTYLHRAPTLPTLFCKLALGEEQEVKGFFRGHKQTLEVEVGFDYTKSLMRRVQRAGGGDCIAPLSCRSRVSIADPYKHHDEDLQCHLHQSYYVYDQNHTLPPEPSSRLRIGKNL